MSQNLINLKCTSCGGTLSIPDNLSVAHCIYCGAKILITESESHTDQLRLKSYTDICESAYKAKNYQEVLDYSNKILEIDSKNVDAWVYKAQAIFWMGIGTRNKYNEAISYLDRAEQLDPSNPKISDIKEEIKHNQIEWLIRRSAEAFKHAQEISDKWSNELAPNSFENALNYSKEYFIKAGNYLLQASRLDTKNMAILKLLSSIVKTSSWIAWGDEIWKKVRVYNNYTRKQEAELSLKKYMESLDKAEKDLSTARQDRGFFGGRKVKEAEERVDKLKEHIASLEEIISTVDSLSE